MTNANEREGGGESIKYKMGLGAARVVEGHDEAMSLQGKSAQGVRGFSQESSTD